MIGAIFGRNIVNVRYTGSTRETTGSLHYSETATDIDMMYIYRDFKISENSTSSDHITVLNSKTPGYVYLKLNCGKSEIVETYKEIARNGEFDSSLHVFSLIENFENNVIVNARKNLSALNINDDGCYGDDVDVLLLRSDYFRYMHEQFNRLRFTGYMTFKQQGPASKIVWNIAGLPQRLMLGYLDIVFALHCKEWPTQANEWLTRQRKNPGFPGKQLIAEIRRYGADIVPKSSYTRAEPSTSIFSWFQIKDFEIENEQEDFHMEWRLSFSIAEIKLVKKWLPIHKCVYRFLKTLRNDYLSKYRIPSYALKNIMFYMLEETAEEVWDLNFLTIVDKFLERLIKCCEESYCPQYFIKGNNLFGSLDSMKLKMAAQRCKELQENWFLTILLSDGLWFEIKIRGYSNQFYDLIKRQPTHSCRRSYVQTRPQCNSEVIQHYDCSMKMYYCFKIQKEAMKYIKNSYISPNYSTSVVIHAIESYLEQHCSILSNLNKEEKVLAGQIAWSLIKCLRFHRNRKHKSSLTNRCIDKEAYLEDPNEIDEKIEDVLGKYILTNESCKAIIAAEYFLQHRFQDCFNQLESSSLPVQSALDEFKYSNQSPILFNAFDQLNVGNKQLDMGNKQTFNFKSSAHFYPICLLKATVMKILNLRDRNNGDEYKDLLDKTSELWQMFPEHINTMQNYKIIVFPLAKFAHKELQ